MGPADATPSERNHLGRVWQRAPFVRRAWNETYGWHVAALLAALAGSLVIFAALADAVADDENFARWDVQLNRWLHEHSSPALTLFFDVVTTAGGFVFLLLVTFVAATVLTRRKERAQAVFVVLAFTGAQIVNGLMKLGFERPRPPFRDPGINLQTFSFPSGHAMVSVAVYGAIAILVSRHMRSRSAAAAAFACVVVLAVTIGASRVYLGAHYVSDVLAGLSLGLAWLMLCVLAVTIRSRQRGAAQRDAPTRL